MYKFLSDEWFAKLVELKNVAGDLNVDPGMASLNINFLVKVDGEEMPMHMHEGLLTRGPATNAATTVIIDAKTLRKVMFEFDNSAAMAAFMLGKLKVQGSMSKIMALQSVKPSAEQKQFCRDILAVTV